MNKRQFKKLKNKQFYEYINSIKKDEVAILSFDMDKIRPDMLHQFADIFKKTIDNKFILLPKDMIQFTGYIGKNEAIKLLESFIEDLNVLDYKLED